MSFLTFIHPNQAVSQFYRNPGGKSGWLGQSLLVKKFPPPYIALLVILASVSRYLLGSENFSGHPKGPLIIMRIFALWKDA
jgi:hypothetical protein